jgi:hypothetical protein
MMMKSILATILTIGSTAGHMMVTSPAPRDSKYNPNVLNANLNYDLVAPVNKYGCSQFHETAPVVKYKAGGTYSITIGGDAPHNGGSCQIGMSFGGEEYISLRDDVGHCLNDGYTYDFTIPEGTPSGKAVIAWVWINRTGNREYYMNCIDAEVEGGSEAGQLTGRSITVANLPGYADVPEGDGGIPITQALYDAERTITISRGNGGYPVKVQTQIGEDRRGKGQQYPIAPVQQPQQPTKPQQQKEQVGDQTPPTTPQQPTPQPTQQPTQPPKDQTPAPGNRPYDPRNPKNKPLVEKMICTPGPPTCEDDTTYIQCAPDNWAYRKFCNEGFRCVMDGSSGTQVNNCVPENWHP